MTFMNQTCSVISRNTAGTAVDAYGNVVPANSGTASVRCEIQQIRREEPGEAGELSVTTWMGFFPTGTVLDTSDIVSEPTLGTFEVVGRPWDANLGSGAVNHLEVTLKEAA